jgi:hypothetical protein
MTALGNQNRIGYPQSEAPKRSSFPPVAIVRGCLQPPSYTSAHIAHYLNSPHIYKYSYLRPIQAMFSELPEESLGRDHSYGVKPIDLTVMAVSSLTIQPRCRAGLLHSGLSGSLDPAKALRSE